MNKRYKNIIILIVFLLGIYILTFSSLVKNQNRYARNIREPFHGIIFEDSSMISDLNIERSIDYINNIVEYSYSFNYHGEGNLEVYILGKNVEDIISQNNMMVEDIVQIVVDNAEIISQKIVKESKLKPIYDNIKDFEYSGVSFIKLNFSKNDTYLLKIKFPMREVFEKNKIIIYLSTFITNAKVDNITDTDNSINLDIGEYYISSIELYNKNLVFYFNLTRYLSVGLFIIAIVYVIISILKPKMYSFILVLISLNYILFDSLRIIGKELSGTLGLIITFYLLGFSICILLAYRFRETQ